MPGRCATRRRCRKSGEPLGSSPATRSAWRHNIHKVHTCVYIYIFMYCYAYIEHSAACFKGRQHLVTPSLAQSPMAVPVLSSVAQCAKFYNDCLTTRQRCGLRLRKGSLWRVGWACTGTDSVIRVLEHLGRSSGWVFMHTFSCECDGTKKT